MNGRRVFLCRASLVPLLAATGAAWAARLKATGSCKMVAGAISPHGYCLAFTPKPSG
jgi:hypothetical protein